MFCGHRCSITRTLIDLGACIKYTPKQIMLTACPHYEWYMFANLLMCIVGGSERRPWCGIPMRSSSPLAMCVCVSCVTSMDIDSPRNRVANKLSARTDAQKVEVRARVRTHGEYFTVYKSYDKCIQHNSACWCRKCVLNC